MKVEMAAQVAAEQEGTPSATLGDGAPGKGPDKAYEDMTYDEKQAVVMAEVSAKGQ